MTQDIIDALRKVAAKFEDKLGDANLLAVAADEIQRLVGMLEVQDEMMKHYVQERDDARREICQLLAQAPGSRASETYAEERGWQYLNARDAGK
jgi:DNA-binding Lrp family transcriptional regulator